MQRHMDKIKVITCYDKNLTIRKISLKILNRYISKNLLYDILSYLITILSTHFTIR